MRENNLVQLRRSIRNGRGLWGWVYCRAYTAKRNTDRYTDEDLAELEANLKAKEQGASASYVMFDNVYSKEDASRFLARRKLVQD